MNATANETLRDLLARQLDLARRYEDALADGDAETALELRDEQIGCELQLAELRAATP